MGFVRDSGIGQHANRLFHAAGQMGEIVGRRDETETLGGPGAGLFGRPAEDSRGNSATVGGFQNRREGRFGFWPRVTPPTSSIASILSTASAVSIIGMTITVSSAVAT